MAKSKDELTPMMRQFYDFKAKHPDALLLFRCGDFYETYNEDAVIASEILGITLTKRSSVAGTSASGTAMGIPICPNLSGLVSVWRFVTSWKIRSWRRNW